MRLRLSVLNVTIRNLLVGILEKMQERDALLERLIVSLNFDLHQKYAKASPTFLARKVHEAKTREARVIIQRGMEAQIRFLMKQDLLKERKGVTRLPDASRDQGCESSEGESTC